MRRDRATSHKSKVVGHPKLHNGRSSEPIWYIFLPTKGKKTLSEPTRSHVLVVATPTISLIPNCLNRILAEWSGDWVSFKTDLSTLVRHWTIIKLVGFSNSLQALHYPHASPPSPDPFFMIDLKTSFKIADFIHYIQAQVIRMLIHIELNPFSQA